MALIQQLLVDNFIINNINDDIITLKYKNIVFNMILSPYNKELLKFNRYTISVEEIKKKIKIIRYLNKLLKFDLLQTRSYNIFSSKDATFDIDSLKLTLYTSKYYGYEIQLRCDDYNIDEYVVKFNYLFK